MNARSYYKGLAMHAIIQNRKDYICYDNNKELTDSITIQSSAIADSMIEEDQTYSYNLEERLRKYEQEDNKI